jgi:hypothetical protein
MTFKSTGSRALEIALANAGERSYGGARGGWSCDLTLVDINPEAALMLPRAFCLDHLVLPVAVLQESIVVVMADVGDVATVDAIKGATGRDVVYGLVAETALRCAIDTYLPVGVI